MERFLELLIIFFVLYVIYALSLGRWDYASEEKRRTERKALKAHGLSARFYFTSPYKLFLLNLLSGGLFLFYWFYKQWRRIAAGFTTAGGKELRFPIWLRAAFGLISMFELVAIVNRTAIYMRKPSSFPAAFWGGVFILSFVGVFATKGASARLTSFLVFITIPCIIQNRINSLAEQPLPLTPQLIEIIITAVSASAWLIFFLIIR